jgi:hypothetical protein
MAMHEKHKSIGAGLVGLSAWKEAVDSTWRGYRDSLFNMQSKIEQCQEKAPYWCGQDRRLVEGYIDR